MIAEEKQVENDQELCMYMAKQMDINIELNQNLEQAENSRQILLDQCEKLQQEVEKKRLLSQVNE